MRSSMKIRKLAHKAEGPMPDGGWPLKGILLEAAPEETTLSTTYVEQARKEGWISLEGESVVARPAGPADEPFRDTHVFHHADTLVIHTLEGDVRYTVDHQPDKYADGEQATYPDQAPDLTGADDATLVTTETYAAGATRVDHFYGLTKES